MSNWQLLDTAPLDGTCILIGTMDGEFAAACWGEFSVSNSTDKCGWCMPYTSGVEIAVDGIAFFWQPIEPVPELTDYEKDVILEAVLPESVHQGESYVCDDPDSPCFGMSQDTINGEYEIVLKTVASRLG